MAANEIGLPDGFVLDQQDGGALPDGFVLDSSPSPKFRTKEEARKGQIQARHEQGRAKIGTMGWNPYINAIGETAVRSLGFPVSIPMGLAKDIQEGDPERMGKTLVKTITGEQQTGSGDILKGAGVPEKIANPVGLGMDVALYPGGARGAIDLAKGTGALAKAGAKAGAKAIGNVVSKAGSKINEVDNEIARKLLNPEFKLTADSNKYGHDPKRVLVDMPDVVGPDIHATGASIENKIGETGQAISDTIAGHPKASVRLNAAKSVTKPFDDKIAELNMADPIANRSAIKRLKEAKQSLQNISNEQGQITGIYKLDNMTPAELWEYRKAKIDTMTKFTGKPSDDAALNSAYQEARRNIKNMLNDTMPELKSLNQDYGDLKAASESVQKVILKAENEGFKDLNLKDFITLGANRWIENPNNRLKLAQWLYKAPKSQVQQLSNSVPGFQQAIQQVKGSQPILNNPVTDFNPIKAQGKPIKNKVANAVIGGTLAAGMAMSGNAEAQTLGEKNNNPINLKAFDKWDGMTGKDSFGHAQFKDLDHGIRASLKNLKNHQKKHPTQSVKAYLNKFAEKNGDKEADYIAGKMGISPNTSLAKVDMEEFLIHLARFESKMELSREEIKRVAKKFKL